MKEITKQYTFDKLFEKYGIHMHRVCPTKDLQSVRPNGLKAYFAALQRFTEKQNALTSNECAPSKKSYKVSI